MWNVNFPDDPVERVFNFSPKDWRKAPTYNLKDQTDSVNAKKIPHLLALATIEDEKRDNTMTIIRGQLDLDHGKIADNVFTLSLAELIKAKTEKKEAPEQAGTAPEQTEAKPGKAKKTTKAGKATKKAAKSTEPSEPINTTSEPEKPVKTEIDEKLPWENEQGPATADFVPSVPSEPSTPKEL